MQAHLRAPRRHWDTRTRCSPIYVADPWRERVRRSARRRRARPALNRRSQGNGRYPPKPVIQLRHCLPGEGSRDCISRREPRHDKSARLERSFLHRAALLLSVLLIIGGNALVGERTVNRQSLIGQSRRWPCSRRLITVIQAAQPLDSAQASSVGRGDVGLREIIALEQ
jgi:hypothetical protein